MKQMITVAIAMTAGAFFGAVAVGGLHAQGKPGAYAVVDIGEISDPDTFKTLLPKAGPAMSAFGGQFVARTEKITAVQGTPPKRFVIIGFDSVEKAKAWSESPAQKEVDAIRDKSTKSREFIIDGAL
jgi:uncharacterized protein (DUF1330 family)